MIVGRVLLVATGVEFEEGGNTIWIHGPDGGTILRIKCSGRVTSKTCASPAAHADVVVSGDIEFCVPEMDAEPEDRVH
jgi:hypothetical protein